MKTLCFFMCLAVVAGSVCFAGDVAVLYHEADGPKITTEIRVKITGLSSSEALAALQDLESRGFSDLRLRGATRTKVNYDANSYDSPWEDLKGVYEVCGEVVTKENY